MADGRYLLRRQRIHDLADRIFVGDAPRRHDSVACVWEQLHVWLRHTLYASEVGMTIRFKLTMGAIAAILVANSLLSLVTVMYLERIWLDEVQTRVRLDLNSARAAYHNHIELISSSLAAASLDPTQAAGTHASPAGGIDCLGLDRLRKAAGIDIVVLLDRQGRVLYRANNPGRYGDSLAHNPWSRRWWSRGRRLRAA